MTKFGKIRQGLQYACNPTGEGQCACQADIQGGRPHLPGCPIMASFVALEELEEERDTLQAQLDKILKPLHQMS